MSEAQSRNILFLIKFFNKPEHARKFSQGHLHMKKLSWFKRHENEDNNDSGRIDTDEATSSLLQPGKGILTLNDMVIEDAQIKIQMDWLNDLHVFCLHAAHTGDLDFITLQAEHDVETLRKQLVVPQKCLSLGNYAVVVKNVGEFVNRIDATLFSKHYLFIRKLVQYYDPTSFHGSFSDDQSVFWKQKRFAYQREFRYAINAGGSVDNILDLDVGDLSDITLHLNTKDLNSEEFLGGSLQFL